MIKDNHKEKREHGSFLLPLGIYNVSLGNIEKSITAHWHNELELILVLSGEFNLKINTDSYNCKEGDIVLINSESLHYFSTKENESSTWNSIVFNMDQLNSTILDNCSVNFITPIINNEFKLPVIIHKDSLINNELKCIILNIIDAYNLNYYGFELEIKSLIFKYFSLLFKFNLVEKKTNNTCLNEEKIEKIKIVLKYIQENYNKEIDIITLSDICHYNQYHFMRFFKKHTGKTCIQFIKNYRLEKAASLISNTDLSITEISLEVGFTNISYFIRSFKEKYNKTPKEFKTRL
ncbi:MULTISPECIES: AraC family transcriptional regulator [Clostridium]|uniref:AraC family transcriptional regulator n=1 Tax=Clostridium TaxID=1485 RepID=UPI0013F75B7A|nr:MULTISPECIES: AraC family transcriptional regulator [Clostridium]MBY7025122.1 helix-turn-helix transcriptional regulator [Clostridium botulinum]NFO47421.1 helix-turn-helix domain-containing protein [Clostridium botulinum]